MKNPLAALAVIATLASPALAQDAVTYSTKDSFDDVTFALESAILAQGLVIDSISHTGDMLERTKKDVGSDVTIFTHADVYSFCSANLSRKVMEADYMNIIFCPYDIFVFARPDSDETVVGFRAYPEGPMQDVQALLDTIAREAAGVE
ncbi:DUF302 domain-containing protein [Actibacterium sp.]|uniref:DUF302 domain-containing protein n=1 Tax=Actibacterium sp. TaxID=1872125 RepID=UPI003565AD50